MAGGTRTGQDAWWAREFERLRPLLANRLRQRGLAWLADDVLANIGLELARRYTGPALHVEANIEEFEQLVWRLTRFRTSDELRALMSRGLRKRSDAVADELSETRDGEESVIRGIDARGFLSHVVERLDRLPEKDRELLTRPLQDETEEPLSGSERVRVVRLRKQLAKAIANEIRGGKR